MEQISGIYGNQGLASVAFHGKFKDLEYAKRCENVWPVGWVNFENRFETDHRKARECNQH